MHKITSFIAALKRSWGQGNMFTGVCLSTGECYPSMYCRWYPSMPCSRSPGGCAIPACLAAGLQGSLQAHTQWGSGGGSGPGPQPREKLRRIWSRPTAKGVVEGIWSRPTAKGVVEGLWSRGVPGPGGGLVPVGCSWSLVGCSWSLGGCLVSGGLPAPGGACSGGGCLVETP